MDLRQRVADALQRAGLIADPDDPSSGYVIEPWGDRTVSVRWQRAGPTGRSTVLRPPQLAACREVLRDAGLDARDSEGDDHISRVIVFES